MKFSAFIFILFFIKVIYGSNILYITPVPINNHFNAQFEIIKSLLQKGNEVTFISPFNVKQNLKNLTTIVVKQDFKSEMTSSYKNLGEFSPYNYVDALTALSSKWLDRIFENNNVKLLLNPNAASFNVVIIEETLSYGLYAFCHHFKSPCILFTPYRMSTYINQQISKPSPVSFVTDFTSTRSNVELGFFERLSNLFYYLKTMYVINFKTIPKHQEIVNKHFKDINLKDLMYNISLVLQNEHFSNNYVVPIIPNVIDIAGFHLIPEPKLSPPLKSYFRDINETIIYVNFGPLVTAEVLTQKNINILLSAFGKLGWRVLWVFEDDKLEGKPENVDIRHFTTHQEILSHSNVKLLITNGDTFSTIDALFHGKPFIGLPILLSEKSNMKFAENNGFALSLNFDSLSEEGVINAVNTILDESRFTENAVNFATILRDQPNSPMVNALYWIEYVMRYSGAKQMRLAALNLYWFQYYFVDVLIGAFTLFLLFLWITLAFWKYCSCKRKKKLDYKKFY